MANGSSMAAGRQCRRNGFGRPPILIAPAGRILGTILAGRKGHVTEKQGQYLAFIYTYSHMSLFSFCRQNWQQR
jgi:hypothetical protein